MDGRETAVPGAGKNERLLGYKNFQPAEMPGSKHFFRPVRIDGSGGEVFRGSSRFKPMKAMMKKSLHPHQRMGRRVFRPIDLVQFVRKHSSR